MRELRHILIMMILCPWIGGTIIGYSAYLNTKVTDLPGALAYLFAAAVGVLLFGLLLTCVTHVLFTSVTPTRRSNFPASVIDGRRFKPRQQVGVNPDIFCDGPFSSWMKHRGNPGRKDCPHEYHQFHIPSGHSTG